MSSQLSPQKIEAQSNPVTIRQMPREMRMFSLGEHELNGLSSPNTGLFLSFFGISVGALVSLTCTLFTVEISDPVRHATFVGMDWIAGFSSLLFGILAAISAISQSRKLKEIKGLLP